MDDELGYKWTVLVGRGRKSKAIMATTMPVKGGGRKFAAGQCMKLLDEHGDQEQRERPADEMSEYTHGPP